MKIIMTVLFLFFPLSLCFSESGNITAMTKVEINDPYTWNFGRVKEGELLKHTFVLKNDSVRVLNIKGMNTSCGCTDSKAEKNTLKPGESTLIEVNFNSKGYSGPVQQFVYVNTDDLDNPVIRYIIKAEAVK